MGIKSFDMVLFMNDIVWCTSDMLEVGSILLSRRIVYRALCRFSLLDSETTCGARSTYDMRNGLGFQCSV